MSQQDLSKNKKQTEVQAKRLVEPGIDYQKLTSSGEYEQLSTLSTMINFVTEAVFAVNGEGVIEMINPVAAQFFGSTREELIGKKWYQFLSEKFREEYEYLFTNIRNTEDFPLNHGPKEVIVNRADGSTMETDLSLSCLPYLKSHANQLFIGVMHNLTTHKAEYNELRRLARTDHLTGLSNRYAFEQSLESAWGQCIEHEQPICLVIIDVDHFKKFNDEHGHVNGDKCLKRIARVIQDCLPSRDCTAARYGGEEFALVLPRCHEMIAELIAKRIKLQISALSFVDLGLPAGEKVTVSQGVACERQGHYDSAESLIVAADSALYQAKANGRNQINTKE